MRIVGWNIRGFGRSGRKTQIKELARKEAADVLLLQETIRQDFTDQELRSLVNGEVFHWQWRSAVIYSSARFWPRSVVLTGRKWATLVRRSMMTQMESCPLFDLGRPVIKSIPTSSHFHVGIFNGWSRPAGLWCSALTR
jgi:hypothetical protein